MEPVARVSVRDFFGNKKYWVCPHCAAINTIEANKVIRDKDGFAPFVSCVTCKADLQIKLNDGVDDYEVEKEEFEPKET